MSTKKKVTKRKPQYFNTKDLNSYIIEEAEKTGKSKEEILEETFHDGFVVISESGDGAFKVESGQLFKTVGEKVDDLTECRRLRERFGPIAACVEYIKDIIMGSGFDVVVDDFHDERQKKMQLEILEWMDMVYQDIYTVGLNHLLDILVDNALTEGFSAAEIVYEGQGNEDLFNKYAKPVTSSMISKESGKLAKTDTTSYEITDPNWTDLKGIARLKIFLDGPTRLKLYRKNRTWEADYWVLDQPNLAGAQAGMTTATQKNLTQGPAMQLTSEDLVRSTYPAGGKLTTTQGKASAYFLPWQIFSLSLTRRTWLEKGPSIILPAMKTAQLLEKIMNAVGEGIYRAGNKKYFIICGTKDRPWGAIHIRNLLSQIKDASEKNWSTIPVPAGFDLKEAGGTVFEAQNAINYFLRVIAGIMHVNPSVMGLDTREARNVTEYPYFTHQRMKDELRNQIRTQLIRLHIWAKYGAKQSKQGGYMDPQWIPNLRVKTEDLLNPSDRLKLDIDILNAANPVMPQTKLEVERDIVLTRGWEVELPNQKQFMEEQKKQQDAQQKLQDAQMKAQIENLKNPPDQPEKKGMGPPSPPSKDKQQKRLDGGVSTDKGGSKGNVSRGSTRIPAEVAESLATISYNASSFKDIEIPETTQDGTTFEVAGPIPDSKITVIIRKLREFVAGYNDDLSRIYIDPAVLPEDFKPIISREIFEYGLERILNLNYDESESMANVWEEYVCGQLGIDWGIHQKHFKKALRIVNNRKEKVENPEDVTRFSKPKKATSDTEYHKKVEETEPQKLEITVKSEPVKTDITLKEDPEKKKAEDEVREKKKKLLDKMEKQLENEKEGDN